MNAINGSQHDEPPSRRKTGRKGHSACQCGRINWFRKVYASSWKRITNPSSLTTPRDFALNADVIALSEKSIITGTEAPGSSREISRTALINSTMNFSSKPLRRKSMMNASSILCENGSMQDTWKTGHSTKRSAPKYTKGVKRRDNTEYVKLINSSHRQRRKGNVPQAEDLKRQAHTLPSVETNDPDSRRLRSVRYADDFLLGLIGPREEAEQIKHQLGTFLQEELKLELSQAKTLITHASTEAARFLGYEITALQDNRKRILGDSNGYGTKTMCRSINAKPGLGVPKDVVEEKCKRYRRKGRIRHRAELVNESVFDIISKDQSEFRGMVNYYQLAYNVHSLHRLKWVMENSLSKTLAHKLRVPVSKIYAKYGTELTVDDQKYKGLQVSIPRQDKKPLRATWGGRPLTRNRKATLEEQPLEVWAGRSELVQRLLADFCELCGSPKDVEVHHVRGMRKLHEYPGRPQPEWVKRMIALKRKTLLLCKTCHEEVEHGLPMTQPAISLTEVKALRKRAGRRN